MVKNHRKDAVISLLQENKMVKVCAPMVRYSKLQFRTLVRKYNCDLCFTPMIMADSFVKSELARLSVEFDEFSTDDDDTPLVVQFAANKVSDFVSAAEMVAPYCDGVDLNCGCPQRWAMQDGYGSALLQKPHIIKDLIYQVRNKIEKPFTVSVKIRILPDLSKTVDLCRQLEAADISFITVHGRTPKQRNEPINIDALHEIRKSVSVPLIANGGIKNLKEAERLHKLTKYQGIMCAEGILENPALFSGFDKTPVSCVQDWVNIGLESKMNPRCFHQHLIFMLEKTLPKSERRIFNALKTTEDVINYLENYFNIVVPHNVLDI